MTLTTCPLSEVPSFNASPTLSKCCLKNITLTEQLRSVMEATCTYVFMVGISTADRTDGISLLLGYTITRRRSSDSYDY